MFSVLEGFAVPPDGPSRRHIPLAADPANDLPVRPRRLYCNANGNITVRDEAGVELNYVGAAGRVIDIAVKDLGARDSEICNFDHAIFSNQNILWF